MEEFYDRNNGVLSIEGIQNRIEDIDQLYSDEYVVAIKLLLSSDKTVRKEGAKMMVDRVIPEGYFDQLRPKRIKNPERFYDSESPKKGSYAENRNSMTMTATQFQFALQDTKKEVLK